MITRRTFVAGTSAFSTYTLLSGAWMAHAGTKSAEALTRRFEEIEAKTGGRLGVAVQDTGSGLNAAWRGDERFPLCSTFKWLLAAANLSQIDAGKDSLDRKIDIRASDMIEYAPVTEKHVGQSMTVGALCEAAVTLSDNTAANLLLSALGGPEAVTAYARTLGDTYTRLDRNEPSLNEVPPGDPRDTTTPRAMAADLQTVVLGDALNPISRKRLTAWLIGNKTGDARLRAGLPESWRVGDKTGTWSPGTANDVGMAWPPNGTPVVITAYLTDAKVDRDRQNAAIADVGRAVAKVIG